MKLILTAIFFRNNFTAKSLQQMYSTGISAIQNTTMTFVQWCGQMIKTTT